MACGRDVRGHWHPRHASGLKDEGHRLLRVVGGSLQKALEAFLTDLHGEGLAASLGTVENHGLVAGTQP